MTHPRRTRRPIGRPGLARFAALSGGVFAIGLGSCQRLIQQNIEVLFAPEVLQNAFLLPGTLVFRLLVGR
jgi:hypothetical protein